MGPVMAKYFLLDQNTPDQPKEMAGRHRRERHVQEQCPAFQHWPQGPQTASLLAESRDQSRRPPEEGKIRGPPSVPQLRLPLRYSNTETRAWPGDHSSGADAQGTEVRFQFIHASQLQKQSHRALQKERQNPGSVHSVRHSTHSPVQNHCEAQRHRKHESHPESHLRTAPRPPTHGTGSGDGTVPLKVCLGHGEEMPKAGQKQGNQTQIPELKGPVSVTERGLDGRDSGRRRGQ